MTTLNTVYTIELTFDWFQFKTIITKCVIKHARSLTLLECFLHEATELKLWSFEDFQVSQFWIIKSILKNTLSSISFSHVFIYFKKRFFYMLIWTDFLYTNMTWTLRELYQHISSLHLPALHCIRLQCHTMKLNRLIRLYIKWIGNKLAQVI